MADRDDYSVDTIRKDKDSNLNFEEPSVSSKPKSKTKSTNISSMESRRDVHLPVEDVPCGWGSFHPDCCQRLRHIRMYLIVITMAGATQGMAVNGFVNTVISTIERRFEISSTESGLIASCYDIMFVIAVIPIAYFGGKGNKPRYLGIGIFTLGIGSFLFALPHFLSPEYGVPAATETVCRAISSKESSVSTCVGDTCHFKYHYFFFAGQLLHGLGATPLYTLGVTYLDENVPQRLSSFYNGIFYAGSILGPAVGYMVGAELLNIYTDFGVDPAIHGLDPQNPRWVGAWWLGFLVTGTLGVLLSIPLLAFPPAMPGADKYTKERGLESQQVSNDPTGQSTGVKDILLSVKLLLMNWPFMCINVATAAIGLVLTGFSTFMPKYIEYQFGVTPANSAFYVGVVVVPAGAGGTFLGGFLVKHYNLKVPGILRICLAASFLCSLFATSYVISCPIMSFAGISLPYGETDAAVFPEFLGTKELDASCNAGCGCTETDYYPMCGEDGVMYFSLCYAGCTGVVPGEDVKMYTNCSCVDDKYSVSRTVNQQTQVGIEGTFGKCESPCVWLVLFMAFFCVQILCIFITSMPSLTATLRCVPNHQRSFGLAIQWIVARCLGSIPGPILFGTIFDLACLAWQQIGGEDGSCLFYDTDQLSVNLLILGVVFTVTAGGAFTIAACTYRAQTARSVSLKDMSIWVPETYISSRKQTPELPGQQTHTQTNSSHPSP